MGLLNLFITAATVLTVVGTVVLVRRLQHPQRKTIGFALANNLPGDPSELGLVFDEKQFRFTDGSTSLAWVVHGACPDAPIMIVSHGWNSFRHGGLVYLPLLAKFASRLVVYDLRGHGESTAPTCRVGITEAKDLLEIVDQLDDQEAPVVLFGKSMGAGVSIGAAAFANARSHQRIVAVIAEGAYRHFREPIAGQLRCRSLPSFPLSHLATAFMALRFGGLKHFDRAALAARLACPLLLLHGVADSVCPIASARQIASQASDGQLVEFPNAGHGNLVQVDELAYIEAIKAFMISIDPSWAASCDCPGS